MPFHDLYQVQRGDNLARIGRAHGYDNPGPLWAYPPNEPLFRGRRPDVLRPGERVHVPHHPDLLRKIISTSEHLIREVAHDATQLIQEQSTSQSDLEAFLFRIDAINFLAGIGMNLGTLAVKGARGVEMTGKEALIWLAESRAAIAGNIATAAIPSPQMPKRDFKFWVRHTLGPWNPSFWASVWTAIQEGDVDLYLYGADATTHRRKVEIQRQAEADIERLRQRITEARAQLGQPFYRHRL